MIQQPQKNPRKSPYVIVSRTKGTSFFPKIQKAECIKIQRSPNNKEPLKKNYAQSIFKIKTNTQLQPPPLKQDLLDDEKVKQSSQYQQLSQQIVEMQSKFKSELEKIQKNCEMIGCEIGKRKKSQYEQKLALWELKNQIMELEQVLHQEEQNYHYLLSNLENDGDNYQNDDDDNYHDGDDEDCDDDERSDSNAF